MLTKFIKYIFKLIGFEISRVKTQQVLSFVKSNSDIKNFEKWYEICSQESLNVSRERFLALYQSILYISKNNIHGDFVECGVFRGGSSMLMSYCLNYDQKLHKKRLWMYDTFEGMTKPSRYDVNILSQKANSFLNYKKKIKNKKDIWAYSPLDTVKKNIEKTKLKKSQYCFVKGAVEQTLKINKPDKISLLRLDTDFYSSTKSELEHLYERVSSNGIILIDDYGHWKGCKKAVDNFFKYKKNIYFHHIDYSAILIIKIK